MLHTIMVPLDGSPLSEQALPYARRLAVLSGATLLLMRAAPYHALSVNPARPGRLPVDEARAYLDRWKQELEVDGLQVETEALHTNPAQAIRFAARLKGADLIVMSSHGRGGMGRSFLGSIADEVLHHATCPVLLIRRDCTEQWADSGPSRVLVPLDGSEAATAALTVLADLTLPANSEVHLLRAVADPLSSAKAAVLSFALDDVVPRARAEARTAGDLARHYLERQALQFEGQRVVRLHVSQGDAATAILRRASEERCDLVIMTASTTAAMHQQSFGTVFEAVLRRTQLPLLSVRPAAGTKI